MRKEKLETRSGKTIGKRAVGKEDGALKERRYERQEARGRSMVRPYKETEEGTMYRAPTRRIRKRRAAEGGPPPGCGLLN